MALAVIAVLLVFLYLRISTDHNNQITLNDLTGLTLEQTLELLEERELNYHIRDSNTYNESYLPLAVVQQNPLPGNQVKLGRTIYLSLNASKPPLVEFPNFVGNKPYDGVLVYMKNRDLVLGKEERRPSIGEGEVLEIWVNGKQLKSDTVLREGTIIDFVVGSGKGDTRVKVPAVLGKTYGEAYFVIAGSDLAIGYSEYDTIGLIDSSTAVIYKQDPAAGSVLREGEGIDIFLSQELPKDVLNKMKEDSLSQEEAIDNDGL